MPDAVHWQPKEEALRDLILLALSQQGGAMRNNKGQVPSDLRVACDIPDTPNNRGKMSTVLGMMERAGLIIRHPGSGDKRTTEVVLVDSLSDEAVALLQANYAANAALFGREEVALESPLEQLIADCQRVLAALQHAAANAKRQTSTGRVAMNVTGVIKSIGIRRDRGKEIRYYLRQLGLAKAVEVCDVESHLWWWEITTEELNVEALTKLATGDRSYLHHQVSTTRGGAGEDTARVRRFAGDAPAVLPPALCGPVTVRRVGELAPEEAEATETTEEPQFEALLRVIAGLEARIAELKDANTRLEAQNATLVAQGAALEQLLKMRNEEVAQVLQRHSDLL